MIVNFYGHACFKLKSKEGTVVTDPYQNFVGFELPNLSADIVTVSHDNPAHNNIKAIDKTTRRSHPFIIDHPGEYEIEGISVFAVKTFQDDQQGSVRGENIAFTFLIDDLRVAHLGSIGHELSDKLVTAIGLVDILFVPVGGQFSINPKQAVKVSRSLEPNIVIPMQYKTDKHDQNVFADMASLNELTKTFEVEPEKVNKLNISRSSLPEETELIILKKS
ncbi:MAG: MBL fold metallo-hydrolase [Patescibacteria group bacterium]|nr:MBL fold metallo-hydrolase [Patescibacteria group bacterium]